MAQNNPWKKKKKLLSGKKVMSCFLFAAVGMAGGLLARNAHQDDAVEFHQEKPEMTTEDFELAAVRLLPRAIDRYDAKLFPLYQHPEKSIMRPLSASDTCRSENDAIICGDIILTNVSEKQGSGFKGFSIFQAVAHDEKTGKPNILSDIQVSEDGKTIVVTAELKNSLIPNDIFQTRLGFLNGAVVHESSYSAFSSASGRLIGAMETEPFVQQDTMRQLGAYAKETRDAMMARMAKQLAKGQTLKR